MTPNVWLATHPYLQPMADLDGLINSTLDEIGVGAASVPVWEDYMEDFVAGIPVLRSSRISIDLRPAESLIASLGRRLTSKNLPGELGQQVRTLDTELHHDLDSPGRAIAWLIDKDPFSTAQPGLLQYLGWVLLARYLRRLVSAFSSWRDEERWLRNYCPLCGSSPAMAQLVGIDPGRLRFLSCGCCATRWRYRRTECPFCERDDHRLAALTVEGSPLRIDYCETCRGYLKTFDGQGSEDTLLADWTSIHLDIVACDQGLKRLAGSLYQL